MTSPEYQTQLSAAQLAILAKSRQVQATHDAQTNAVVSETEEFVHNEYVLVSPPDNRPRDKLLARWQGPFRVGKKFRNSYEVLSLVDKQTLKVSGNRIKRFHAGTLSEERIREIAMWDGQSYEVDDIVAHNFDQKTKVWTFEVKWRGHEKTTWEPLDNVKDNAKFKDYKKTHRLKF